MASKTHLKPNQLRTWVEIDRAAVKHNLKLFRSLIPRGTLMCAVVKSNAYGHGLAEFACEAQKAGADMLAVDSVIEGIRLREHGIKARIFVLGYTLPAMLREAAQHDIEVTIAGMTALKEAVRQSSSKKIKIHLKIDTGMSRQGFFDHELEEALDLCVGVKHIEIVAIYTHYANAKNPAFPRDTYEQMHVFDCAVRYIRERGYDPLVHAAATSTTILFPEEHRDMVRIGIGSYGLWPSKETRAYATDCIDLKPVLTWKAVLADVKDIPKGAGISYGFTERVKKKTRIGIIPVGYWHGYPRVLSSVGHVLVNGKRARILGVVTMDSIIVDLSQAKNARTGDEVVLLGRQGKEEVCADEWAYLADTINYEIVTRINPKIKRLCT